MVSESLWLLATQTLRPVTCTPFNHWRHCTHTIVQSLMVQMSSSFFQKDTLTYGLSISCFHNQVNSSKTGIWYASKLILWTACPCLYMLHRLLCNPLVYTHTLLCCMTIILSWRSAPPSDFGACTRAISHSMDGCLASAVNSITTRGSNVSSGLFTPERRTSSTYALPVSMAGGLATLVLLCLKHNDGGSVSVSVTPQ